MTAHDEDRDACCQNCGYTDLASCFGEIRDFWSRVRPGEVVPVGECPECGALAHYADPPYVAQPLRVVVTSEVADKLTECGIPVERLLARDTLPPFKSGGFNDAMNQYELRSAALKIDGYYNPPRTAAGVDQAFETAKAECVEHLRRALANVEGLTVEQFFSGRAALWKGPMA